DRSRQNCAIESGMQGTYDHHRSQQPHEKHWVVPFLRHGRELIPRLRRTGDASRARWPGGGYLISGKCTASARRVSAEPSCDTSLLLLWGSAFSWN
ncbi:hypothetical protein BaRGS_00007816, partial [Batillaria attramentaria]